MPFEGFIHVGQGHVGSTSCPWTAPHDKTEIIGRQQLKLSSNDEICF